MSKKSSLYKITAEAVFFQGRLLRSADPKSFVPLQEGWGKDRKNVYSNGSVIRVADARTFEALNGLFGRDSASALYIEGKIPDADAKTFRVLDAGLFKSDYDVIHEGYAADKRGILHYAYSFGKPLRLKKADAGSFEVMKCGYAKDVSHVYSSGRLVKSANPATFVLISERYGKDGQHVFYGDRIVEGANPATFKVVDHQRNHARDNRQLYVCHQRVKAYPPKFKLAGL